MIKLPKSTLDALPKSVLGENQGVLHREHWTDDISIQVTFRYGHKQHGGGCNTLSISACISGDDMPDREGFYPDEISKHFPRLAKYLKWHMFTSHGPASYPVLASHCANKSDLCAARNSLACPEDNLFYYTERQLLALLPSLMLDFKRDMESLGFIY